MMPLAIYSDQFRIELSGAYLEPWSYQSPSNACELVDLEIQEEDVSELIRLLDLQSVDRRTIVVSLACDPGNLVPAQLRLSQNGHMTLTIAERQAIRSAKTFRPPC